MISKSNYQNSYPFVVGVYLLTFLFALFFVTVLGQILNIGISWVDVPLSVVIASVFTLYEPDIGLDKRRRVICILLTVLSFVLLAVALSYFSDRSFDGNVYHQQSVLYQTEGWNPIYQSNSRPEKSSMCINHYAHFNETVQAAILSLSSDIESSKVVNFILYISSLLIFYETLRSYGNSKTVSLSASVMMGCNPVVVTQLLTFYVDYAIFCELLILCSIFALILKSPFNRILWVYTFFVTVIAINTKFTHFFYIGIIWVAFLSVLVYRKNFCSFKSALLAGCAAMIVGIFILGFHPYVTNFYYHGHIFYPLLGDNSIDIMTYNTPDIYVGNNRLQNFVISMVEPWWGIDWANHDSVITALKTTFSYDARYGGFSPLFPVMLVFAIGYAFVGGCSKWVWFLALVLFIMAFIFEQTWWARYVCWLWSVPIMLLLGGHKSKLKSRVMICCCWVCLVVGCFAFGKSAIGSFLNNRMRSLIYEAMCIEPLKVANLSDLVRYKFDTAGAKYIIVPIDSINRKHAFSYYFDIEYSRDIIELSDSVYGEILKNPLSRPRVEPMD